MINPKTNSTLPQLFDLEAKRLHLWHQLEELSHPLQTEYSRLESCLIELSKVDRFWAYPGTMVMLQIKHYLATQQWELFHQLCHNTLETLINQSYRKQTFIPFGTNLMQLDKPSVTEANDLRLKGRRASANKTYFEVLVIHPNPAEYEQLYRNSLSAFKTEKDEFIYDIIFVNNVEDALTAILANPSIQACVHLYGFQLNSPSNIFSTEYAAFIEGQINLESIVNQPLIGLKQALQQLRPELSHYLISEVALAAVDNQTRAHFHRILFHVEPFQDLHFTLLGGIRDRFSTPFFDALRAYSRKPKGVFHALPLSRGQSLKDSHWVTDMLDFYGSNIFLAETSSTQGGMDSLLDPKGAIKQAQDKAAIAFQSKETFFVTNGTSTSNKIVMQANLQPGDIVLTSADCHKSIPYAVMLSGAYPIFLETYPINEFDLYGAVPLERIKQVLLDLKEQGELHRVKQITLTNSTFDGLIYHTERFMMEILAIKPDIIFHWDEAWFAYAYFNPIYHGRTAMSVANKLQAKFQNPEYRAFYAQWKHEHAELLNDGHNAASLLMTQLFPDPDKVILRVYSTQSTHKTLTAFRQGSMLHIFDEQFNRELFLESYRMHTSTSPNYQIIASLDVGRRQVSLEGYERVKRAISLANSLRQRISKAKALKPYFKILTDNELVPEIYRSPSGISKATSSAPLYGYADIPLQWDDAQFVVDPTKITVEINGTGMDGCSFRELLINKYDIQVNKTSRSTVLFIVNIGANQSTIDYLFQVLCDIANRLSQRATIVSEQGKEQIIELPQRRKFHPAFIPYAGKKCCSVDMRSAYYAAFNEENITYVPLDNDTLKHVLNDGKLVSAAFVTPYPPGFPVIVPGQIITHDILLYLQKMRIKEIHGYRADLGLKIFSENYLASLSVK